MFVEHDEVLRLEAFDVEVDAGSVFVEPATDLVERGPCVTMSGVMIDLAKDLHLVLRQHLVHL